MLACALALVLDSSSEPPIQLPPIAPAPQLKSVPETRQEEALRFTAQLDRGNTDRSYALERLRKLGQDAAPAIPRLLCEIEMHIQEIVWRQEPLRDFGWVDDAARTLVAVGAPAARSIVEVLVGGCSEAVGRRLDGRPCRNPKMDPELCGWRRHLLLKVLKEQGQVAVGVLHGLEKDGPASLRAVAARTLIAIGQ
jgi:hypothetical protein